MREITKSVQQVKNKIRLKMAEVIYFGHIMVNVNLYILFELQAINNKTYIVQLY